MANEITFTDVTGEKYLVTCSACPSGAVILGEMQDEHRAWHQKNDVTQDLSHLGGANDPGPMPPRER